jgi:transcriptional regulator with XRE-family HTH domain
MSAFADKLRRERESRKATVEEVASATGIDSGYLEALERNDVGALPGRAFGMLYIRAYADMLGFDPKPLIEEYERENPRSPGADSPSPSSAEPGRVRAAIAAWREEKRAAAAARAAPEEVPEPAPVEAASKPTLAAPEPPAMAARAAAPAVEPPSRIVEAPRSRSGRGLLVAGIAAVAIVVGAWAYILLGSPEEEVVLEPRQETTTRAAAPEIPAPPPSPPVETPTPKPTPPPASRPAPPPAPAATPSRLEVVEPAVGRRLVNRRVETPVDRFAPGELAWFSTRVLGGRSGDSIRHVWMRDGKTIWSKDLGIGAADWRTQTSKRLTQPGSWTAEARDREGRVLASVTFSCAPGER